MITLDTIWRPSEDVVVREIEGEIIIVPLTAGIGELDDELYTLNDTGRAVIRLLDGNRTLRHVASELTVEYEATPGEIERDVTGLVAELIGRKMLVEVTPPSAT